MKSAALKVLITAAVLIPVAIYAQPRAGNPTTATVITKAEIDKISATEQSQTTRDENARVMDIGDGWSMEVGVIHRGKQHVMTVAEAAAAASNAPAGAARGAAAAGGACRRSWRGRWQRGTFKRRPPSRVDSQMATSSGGRTSGRHHA